VNTGDRGQGDPPRDAPERTAFDGAPRRRALLLDRDGTLIEDVGYPKDPKKDIVLLRACLPALKKARDAGFILVVISNQSGVARGYFDVATACRFHEAVEAAFEAEGITFDGVYFCFHGPDDGCACRKPMPGLLHEAARQLDFDLASSIMIGDKDSDLEAGRAAGCMAMHASWREVMARLDAL
jgi:D-glycero-D-manno-heptose 1,7-bisphosphate phosphatase